MNGQILRADGEDLLDALRTSKCVAIIIDPTVPKGVYSVLVNKIPLEQDNSVKSENLPHLDKLIVCARGDSQNDFITSLKNPELQKFRADVSPTDLATVMTTSGSTGYSKLVKLSHANICHFGKQVKGIEPLPSGTHFVNCASLGWAGGYPQWYLSCGVTRYFIDMHDGPPPDIPALLWKIMVQERIVYGFMTPMYVNAILTKCSWQTAEWKPNILCLAGQPVRKEQLSIIGKVCNAVDVNYGMTECNLVTTHRIVDPSNYTDGCAGYPGYGVKVKVVDANRQEVPQGSTGEILVWSPSLCSGYLDNDPVKASAFTQDGWFCTDDAGYVDVDGKLYVQGRQSDSILRGVYILYPGWLEKKMRDVPGVRDIAVVAVPDSVLCNEICACLVVTGVKGIVAGCLDSSKSIVDGKPSLHSHQAKDDINIDVVIENHKSSCSTYDEKSTTINSQTNDCDKPSLINLCWTESKRDQIIQKDINQPLSLPSNERKESSGHVEDSINKQTVLGSSKSCKTNETNSLQNVDVVLFEEELRNFANNLNTLHENDAMRMVPKYYVFFENFPVTITGKVNRKEIRKLAAAALRLD
uniref:Medium-chain acyl-CoA ligase ACSF2, mitochondrial n=1 Tax=Arion vulgaris TaxID=1028688 RepID=A0A0B7ATP0_9EUPU